MDQKSLIMRQLEAQSRERKKEEQKRVQAMKAELEAAKPKR